MIYRIESISYMVAEADTHTLSDNFYYYTEYDSENIAYTSICTREHISPNEVWVYHWRFSYLRV